MKTPRFAHWEGVRSTHCWILACKRAAVIPVLGLLLCQALGQSEKSVSGISQVPQFKYGTGVSTSTSEKLFASGTHVVFLYCSCDECAAVAKVWQRFQKAADARQESRLDDPQIGINATIIYVGDQSETDKFAKAHGLGGNGVTMIADADSSIAKRFRGMPCPTAYVVTDGGRVRFNSKLAKVDGGMSPEMFVNFLRASLSSIKGPSSNLATGASNLPEVPASYLRGKPRVGQVASNTGGLEWKSTSKTEDKFREVFKFVNSSSKPIVVRGVQGSCGCTDFRVESKGAEILSTVLAPGESLTVTMSLRVLSGPVDKTAQVWIYGDAIMPIAYAKMTLQRDATKIRRNAPVPQTHNEFPNSRKK